VRFLIDECLTVDLVSVAGQFAPDSPLEADGFEPSVPVAREPVYIAEMNWGIDGGSQKKFCGVPMVRIHLPSRRESTANLALAVPRAVAPC
jgi:hypothetical protein